MMPVDNNTVDLVAKFEGCELKAYKCPAGVLTIGYGHTNNAGFGPKVKVGDVWTKKQAREMLIQGILHFQEKVFALLKIEPTDGQLAAMTSLAYNIGIGAFSRSTCLKRFNNGNIEGAAEALMWFNKAGGKVLRGLVRRREAELEMFLSHKDDEIIGLVDEPKPHKSKTLGASTLTTIAGGAGATVSAISVVDPITQYLLVGVFGVIILAGILIFKERLNKAF